MANGERRTAWSYQGYGFILFMRHRAHGSAKCGHPQYYVISRYAAQNIGKKAKPRLRKPGPDAWREYRKLHEKLAWGKILRGKERANDKHKASLEKGTGPERRKARSIPTDKSTRLCRFRGLATEIEREAALFWPLDTNLHGWITNRLGEWHSRARIISMLGHAASLLPDRDWQPDNAHAFLCGIAEHHLDSDGLAKIQRKRDVETGKKTGRRRSAPTFSEDKIRETFLDHEGVTWYKVPGLNDWKKL